MSSRCQTSTRYSQTPPPGRVNVTAAFIDICNSIPSLDHKRFPSGLENSDLLDSLLFKHAIYGWTRILKIPLVLSEFTSIYLLYLFRPLTPLNIFKGVDVIGGLKIGQ